MAETYIIANWKSHLTEEKTTDWLASFAKQYRPLEGKTVIICPPDLLVPLVAARVKEQHLAVSVGLQDFSPFASGPHTGEEPPELARELANYTIIGHSERRRELGETPELIAKKAASALSHSVRPIVCVQGRDVPVPEGVSLVAYEPLFAIGSGKPDTPEDAEGVAKALTEKYTGTTVIYGGSVTPENVRQFTSRPLLRGVLIGGASLDPVSFTEIIKNA